MLLSVSQDATIKIFEALRYEELFYVYIVATLVLGLFLTFASFSAWCSARATAGRCSAMRGSPWQFRSNRAVSATNAPALGGAPRGTALRTAPGARRRPASWQKSAAITSGPPGSPPTSPMAARFEHAQEMAAHDQALRPDERAAYAG